MAATRKRQREAGFYETTVFVHNRVRDAIDRAIAGGRFKSRREAMEYAIQTVFPDQDRKATPR
jgi:Arc/MetJ-type ribon-helix-helix transcriptional regulator